jgi:hypothetical protein
VNRTSRRNVGSVTVPQKNALFPYFMRLFTENYIALNVKNVRLRVNEAERHNTKLNIVLVWVIY